MREVQMSIGELDQHLSDVVNRVTRNNERVVLLSDGRPAAAIIGLEDLRRLQTINDNVTAEEYASVLTAADQVREQIQQWQTQYIIRAEDSVETLRQLREARDASFDDVR